MATIKRTSGFFEYNRKTKTMVSALNILGLPSYPEALEVISITTGRIVKFYRDTEAAIRNEFWDGEQMEYYTKDTDINRVRLVIGAYLEG